MGDAIASLAALSASLLPIMPVCEGTYINSILNDFVIILLRQ